MVAAMVMMTQVSCAFTIIDFSGMNHISALTLEYQVDIFTEVFGVDAIPETDLLLVTERKGPRLVVLRDGEKINEIPIVIPGREMRFRLHSGLLDVFVDPDFAESKTIYLSATLRKKDEEWLLNHTLIAAEFDATTGNFSVDLSEENILWEQPDASRRCLNPFSPTSTGGRIAMMPDGSLLFSIGHCGLGSYRNAQPLNFSQGKLLRMTTDGKPVCGIATMVDNPFCRASDRADWNGAVTPYIYSYGHKNQQGIAIDAATNRVFASEHGMRGGDEINIITAGANYGFPHYCSGCITYLQQEPPIYDGELDANQFQRPLFAWNYETISVSPSGLAFYGFPGVLESSLLAATLKGEGIYLVRR